MNKLIIYIEAHEKSPMNFGNQIVMHLRKHYKNNTLLDLDNFSAPDLFSHATTACQEEGKATLIIKTENKKVKLGPILPFINKLIRTSSVTIDSILLNEHPALSKMLSKTNSFNETTSEKFFQNYKA